MTILPLNDVKTRFSAIADEVNATHDRVIVTRNGRPHIMLIAVDDFESMQMTHELRTGPGALEEIRAELAEIDAGRFSTIEDVRADLARRLEREIDAT